MPLFLASNAIDPTDMMSFRAEEVLTPQSADVRRIGLGCDCGVMILATTVLVIIGARLSPWLGA